MPGSPIRFHIDRCDHAVLAGWVDNGEALSSIDIDINGEWVGSLRPDLYRKDLERAGIGDGRRAFEFSLAGRLHAGENVVTISHSDSVLTAHAIRYTSPDASQAVYRGPVWNSFTDWLKAEVDKEVYWFHRMELAPGFITPGWSDPKIEKLPYFGLPDDMTGMRVLDIGCAEGFFSFEAERRGAREVIAIDSFTDSVRRFNICRAALGSRATALLTNVYDLTRRGFGTFDLVMFFGVLYHLRNRILALEKIFSVCSGTLLLQSWGFEDPAIGDQAMARFYPFGVESGPPGKRSWDPTVFWSPNAACVRDMLTHTGVEDVERIVGPIGHVFRARVPVRSAGTPPDPAKAPWN
jgi:tRNA (mo5U34)-methyltransferase